MEGGKWRDSRFGTITVKTGNKWIICWDISNLENAMECDILFKEDDNAPIVCTGVSPSPSQKKLNTTLLFFA